MSKCLCSLFIASQNFFYSPNKNVQTCTAEQNYSTDCNITIEQFKRINYWWSGSRVAGVSVHELAPVAGTNGRIKQQAGVAAVSPHLPSTLQSLFLIIMILINMQMIKRNKNVDNHLRSVADEVLFAG